MQARLSPLLRPFRHLKLAAFLRARQGVAALEFALVAPVMVVMFLGMTEVTVGVNTDRKLALVSRTLADLTARASQMTTADMTTIFTAAKIVMQPYSTTALKMVVSSVTVTTSGSTTTGSIAWSCASGSGATARAPNSSYTVPDSFKTATSFIVVETSLDYTPMFGGQFTGGTLKFNETTPWPVRNASSVVWSGSNC
jgi:Flp pilus assembly protein TadG